MINRLLTNMVRQKAQTKRTTMKVPITFRDSVRTAAKSAGVDATVYLENCTVIRTEADAPAGPEHEDYLKNYIETKFERGTKA